MSAFCIGTERYYNSVRNSIVKFMQLHNNCNIFSDQFGFSPNLVYTSVNDYIQQTGMNKKVHLVQRKK